MTPKHKRGHRAARRATKWKTEAERLRKALEAATLALWGIKFMGGRPRFDGNWCAEQAREALEVK